MYLTKGKPMRNTLILLASALVMSTFGCNGAVVESLERDKEVLKGKHEVCLETMKQAQEQAKRDLEDAHRANASAKQSMCDTLDSRVQNRLTATGVRLTEGKAMTPSPCDPDVAVAVRKIRGDYALLKYRVRDETRYSDHLYFQGKKSDRSSLFIQDLPDPMILTVAGCDGNTCDVECYSLDSSDLTCKDAEAQ
jgi:hypothetical protein